MIWLPIYPLPLFSLEKRSQLHSKALINNSINCQFIDVVIHVLIGSGVENYISRQTQHVLWGKIILWKVKLYWVLSHKRDFEQQSYLLRATKGPPDEIGKTSEVLDVPADWKKTFYSPPIFIFILTRFRLYCRIKSQLIKLGMSDVDLSENQFHCLSTK